MGRSRAKRERVSERGGRAKERERESRSLSTCKEKRVANEDEARWLARKGKKEGTIPSTEDVAENTLLIISPKGEEADPAKKGRSPIIPLGLHPTLGGPLSVVSTLSALLFAMLILARKLQLHETSRVCIFRERRASFNSQEGEKELGNDLYNLRFKRAV